MSTLATYPSKDGWIRAELTMTSAEPMPVDNIKKLLSWGNVDSCEFGPISQRGKKVKAIYREKRANAEGEIA